MGYTLVIFGQYLGYIWVAFGLFLGYIRVIFEFFACHIYLCLGCIEAPGAGLLVALAPSARQLSMQAEEMPSHTRTHAHTQPNTTYAHTNTRTHERTLKHACAMAVRRWRIHSSQAVGLRHAIAPFAARRRMSSAHGGGPAARSRLMHPYIHMHRHTFICITIHSHASPYIHIHHITSMYTLQKARTLCAYTATYKPRVHATHGEACIGCTP